MPALRDRRELESRFTHAMEINEIVEKVSSFFEVNLHELRSNVRAKRVVDARSVICYLAIRQAGHSGVEVGKYLNLRRAGASVAAGRGEKIIIDDPSLAELLDK